MITDASNKERDQMNAMAQERRAQAGELGAHTVELPGKPYGLRAGDEIIFTAQYPVPGEKRVENGITGTVIDASRNEDTVTIKTREHEPREVRSTPASSPTSPSATPCTSTRARASPRRRAAS